MSLALAGGLTWATIIAAYLVFQIGRARGQAEVEARVLADFALILPALEEIAQMVDATGYELDRQTKEQLDAIRKVAAWN